MTDILSNVSQKPRTFRIVYVNTFLIILFYFIFKISNLDIIFQKQADQILGLSGYFRIAE